MPYFRLLCLVLAGLSLQAQTKETAPLSPGVTPIESMESELDMEIPRTRNNLTITESARLEAKTAQEIGANYNFEKISGALSQALENDEASHSRSEQADARIHLRDVLIGFILEIALTLLVLMVAFSFSGFPYLLYQVILLSLAVAFAGAALEYFMFIGLFNPIRIGLSFIILLILIRQLTDVREWATAIRIALLARFISLGMMWVAYAGLMAIFGL